jgi:leader peptidase (prepilin peptidase)/N-methyltransferase
MNDALFYISYVAQLLCGFFFFGALASFMGVVVERVPKKESIMGRSHCICGEPIPFYRNIPVVSWALQGGKAKCCGAKIPAWYFVSELIAGLAGLALTWILLEILLGQLR